MAHEIVLHFSDQKGKNSDSRLFVPTGFTLAQYSTFVNSLIGFVINFLGGAFNGAELCLDVDPSAIVQTGKPTPTSDSENVGEFIFVTDAGFKTVVNLPGYDESHTVAGSDALDTNDTAVATFVQAMIAGLLIGANTVQPCDIGGDDIDALLTARERFRNSGPAR